MTLAVSSRKPRQLNVGVVPPPKSPFVAPLLLLAGSFLYIDVGAQLYVLEIGLGVALVHLALSGSPSRLPRWAALTLLAWLFAAILSDLAAQSPTGNTIRGLARVVFLAVDVLALAALTRYRRWSIVAMWSGVVVSQIASYFIQPSTYAHEEPWKFGFAMPFTLGMALLAERGRRLTHAIVFPSIAAINFVLGFRSLALVCMLSFAILALRRSKDGYSGIAKARSIFLVGGSILVSLILVRYYDTLALSGTLGDQLRQKALYQSQGVYGSLASGRVEILLATRSIAEHPLLGGGSYSLASSDVVLATAMDYVRAGYDNVAAGLLRETPPYHSAVFGSWAENGLFGVLFWIGFILTSIKYLLTVFSGHSRLVALSTFVATLGIWDALFSPFGAEHRLWTALTLVTIWNSTTLTKGREKVDQDINCHD